MNLSLNAEYFLYETFVSFNLIFPKVPHDCQSEAASVTYKKYFFFSPTPPDVA